jgi:hypothetical protein
MDNSNMDEDKVKPLSNDQLNLNFNREVHVGEDNNYEFWILKWE